MSIKESRRPTFEQAVIDRMKEGGFLEVEIRVECLARSGDGYYDGSVDAYWHFWNTALDGVVMELPHPVPSICKAGKGRGDEVTFHLLNKEGDPIGGEPQDHCMDCTRPIQQVSVPDGKVCVPVEVLRLYEFMAASFTPLTSQHEQIAISLRKAKAAMLAAPAAPAADAGLVDMYRHLQTVTPYRFKKIQDASVTDGGDVLYFHKDRFDAALLDDIAAHRAKGVV